MNTATAIIAHRKSAPSFSVPMQQSSWRCDSAVRNNVAQPDARWVWVLITRCLPNLVPIRAKCFPYRWKPNFIWNSSFREYLNWERVMGRIMERVEVRVQTARTQSITAWLQRTRYYLLLFDSVRVKLWLVAYVQVWTRISTRSMMRPMMRSQCIHSLIRLINLSIQVLSNDI